MVGTILLDFGEDALTPAGTIILRCLAAIGLVFGVASFNAGADEPNAEQALKLIFEAAEKICQSAPIEQNSSGAQLSGEAKAQLGGIVGKLTDLGIKGAGQYETNSSRGVLQKDLADSIKSGNDCRLRVFDVLSQRLLVPPSPLSPSLSPATSVPPKNVDQVLIVARSTTLRRTPNPYGPQVEDVSAGAKVVLLPEGSRDDGWVRVRVRNSQTDGYINLSDLMKVPP